MVALAHCLSSPAFQKKSCHSQDVLLVDWLIGLLVENPLTSESRK
jgi:hypothetical protein